MNKVLYQHRIVLQLTDDQARQHVAMFTDRDDVQTPFASFTRTSDARDAHRQLTAALEGAGPPVFAAGVKLAVGLDGWAGATLGPVAIFNRWPRNDGSHGPWRHAHDLAGTHTVTVGIDRGRHATEGGHP